MLHSAHCTAQPILGTTARGLRVQVALCVLLTCCLLLTGFAAQVPSAPIDVPPAPPTSGAHVQTSAPVPISVAEQHALQPEPEFNIPVDTTAITVPTSILPGLQWFLDPSGNLTARDMIGEDVASRFKPWNTAHPTQSGVLWLRLELAPMITGMREQLYLHLGPAIPDTPQAWMRRPGSMDPIVVRPEEQGTYPILYSHNGGEFFLRLERWPAFGFTPWLGSLESDAENMATLLRYAILALLFICALTSLARGLLERREWRIWAGLFSVAALLQGVWGLPGLPLSPSSVWNMPFLLAPAFGLFFLPQAGRQLMQPRNTMVWLDNLFLAVMLAGLLIGLIPLLPSHSWFYRYMPLWPLGLLPTAVLSVFAWRKGLAGCGRFFVASILAGSGALLLMLFSGGSAESALYLSLASLTGLASSSLLLAVVGGRPSPRATLDRRSGTRKGARGSMPLELDLPSVPLPPSTPDGAEEVLRPIIINEPQRTEQEPSSIIEQEHEEKPKEIFEEKKTEYIAVAAVAPAPRPAPIQNEQTPGAAAVPYEPRIKNNSPAHEPGTLDADTLIRLEETLRVPLDAMLRESIALDMCELPEEARRHVAALIVASKSLTSIVTGLSRSGLPDPARVVAETSFIDLPKLLREAHDHVEQAAEARNVAVSWYMAPHLGRRYAGPHNKLIHALRMLMESAVQATERGSIQLWVRRHSDSNDPGHLVFTVADTGSGMPPERRSPLLPAKIWELVGETGGTMHIDSGPEGTTFSFSVLLKPLPAHGQLPPDIMMPNHINELDTEPLNMPSLRILIADDNPSRRQLTAYMLEDLPHDVIEARSSLEAVSMHQSAPARLIVFDASMPEKDLVDSIASIRSFDGSRDEAPTTLLAVATYAEQGEVLSRAGIDYVIYRPVSRSIVRQAVLHMAPPPGTEVPPLPVQEPPRAPKTETPPIRQVAETAHSTTFEERAGAGTALDSAGQQPTQNEIIAQVHGSTSGAPGMSGASSGSLGQHMQPVTPASVSGHISHTTQHGAEPATEKAPRQSVMGKLLGAIPRKRAARSMPNIPAPQAEQAPEERLASRSVGDPRPMPPSAPAETRRQTPPQRPSAPWVAPPRLANPSDDSLLSENGVGEPMPVIKKTEAMQAPQEQTYVSGFVSGKATQQSEALSQQPRAAMPSTAHTTVGQTMEPAPQTPSQPEQAAQPYSGHLSGSESSFQAAQPQPSFSGSLAPQAESDLKTQNDTGHTGAALPQVTPQAQQHVSGTENDIPPTAAALAEQSVSAAMLPEQNPSGQSLRAAPETNAPDRPHEHASAAQTPSNSATSTASWPTADPRPALSPQAQAPVAAPSPAEYNGPAFVEQPASTTSASQEKAEPISSDMPAQPSSPAEGHAGHSEMVQPAQAPAFEQPHDVQASMAEPVQTAQKGPEVAGAEESTAHSPVREHAAPQQPVDEIPAVSMPAEAERSVQAVDPAVTAPELFAVQDAGAESQALAAETSHAVSGTAHGSPRHGEQPAHIPASEVQTVENPAPAGASAGKDQDDMAQQDQQAQPVRGSLLDLIHHVGPSDPDDANPDLESTPVKGTAKSHAAKNNDVPGLTEIGLTGMGDTLPGTTEKSSSAVYDASAFEPKSYNEHAFEPAPFEPLTMINKEDAPAPTLPGDDGQQDALVEELLRSLDETLVRVQSALYRRDTADVVESTGVMADYAERYGLHVLARLSRGMQEMAVEVDGLDTVKDTMPDLRAAVERNRGLFKSR